MSPTDLKHLGPVDHPARDRAWCDQLHATAIMAARAAGRVQQKYFGGRQQIDSDVAHDLKLAVDRYCQKAMLDVVRERFPDHGIIAEEDACFNPEAPYRWYLDPLDGTVNYFLGLPYFCACAACYFHPPDQRGCTDQTWDYPLTGVVYAPVLDQCFEAMVDGPALCNGRPIKTGNERQLEKAVIGFSFGSDSQTMQRMQAISRDLMGRARKLRFFGATGLDLAHVASGRLSGLVQGRVQPWDFAAARAIVAAAGGYFRADSCGLAQWQIVAAAPGIGRALQTVVDRHTI